MPTLIDRNGRRDDSFARVDEDSVVAPEAAVLLTLAQWQAEPERWRAHAGPVGVQLAPSDDPAEIAADLARFALVAVEFPVFSDGRGFSSARLLRQRYGFRGELRAVGDVLRDPLFYMARCGFDTFALADGVDVDAALAAFADFRDAYQAAVDRDALFARRFAGTRPQQAAA